MADKKKGFKLGGVDFSGFHFNSPMLQEAYQKWFIDAPLRAPVEIEYVDPIPVTSTGAVKQSPTYTTMDPYERARGEMMEKMKYGWETGNDAVFPQVPRNRRRVASRGTKAAAKLADSKTPLGKGGAALLQGRDNANARIAALGGDPVGQDKGGSIWNTIMENLLRGNYAVAEGINRADKASKDGTNPLEQVLEFGKGAVQGATLKKKTTFGNLLERKNFGENIEDFLTKYRGKSRWGLSSEALGNIGQGITAGALDIGLDPTTYVGAGLVAKPGQALARSAKAAEHLKKGSEVVSRGRKTPHTFDEMQEELLTGGRHIKGKVKHSEEGLIYEPLRAMRNSIERTRFKEIRDELRMTDEWARIFDRGGKAGTGSLTAATKQLNDAAREIAMKEAEDWLTTALRNYQDVVATQIQKGVGIGAAFTGGKKATVIPAPMVSYLGRRVNDIDVVRKGLSVAQKYLKADAGVSTDLYNLRAQATASGMAKAQLLGHRLRKGFSGMHLDVKESTWNQGLNRQTASGQRVVIDDIEQDAAEFFNKEIDILDQNARGISTGNTPMSAKELEAHLPPRFRGGFKNGKDGAVDVRESLKTWEMKDGPHALFLAQQAYEQANTVRSMYVSAADTFGVRTLGEGAMKNATKIFDDLKRRGWREVNETKTHGLLKGVLFDDETAKGMEKLVDLMANERNWNSFLQKLAHITGPIKFLLTVPNPGYHIRNSIGDAFINEIDNVSLNSYGQAARVLNDTAKKYGGKEPLLLEEGNLLERAFARPAQTVLFNTKKPLRKPNGVRSTVVTEAEIYAGMNQYGITQTFSLSEFSNTMSNPNAMNRLGSRTVASLTEMSSLRENYFRVAHFIDLVKKNPSNANTLDEAMAFAAARVRKTHFDYASGFTRWEKQVASNVIPFYKWTRKAVPLMMEIMFTNPGKAIMPTKAQAALSQMAGYDPYMEDPFPNLEGMLPKWMIEAGYTAGNPASVLGLIPGIDDEATGGPGMFALPNPFTDTFTQTIGPAIEGAKQGPSGIFNFLMQQSNPVIKVPYELNENKNTFLSRSGSNVPIYREDTKKEDLKNYFLQQLPYARQLNRAFGGEKEKQNFGALGSQLTGIYNQQLTPSTLKGETYRQSIEAANRLSDLKEKLTEEMKKKGIKPPQTSSEWDDFLEDYAKYHGLEFKRPKRKSKFELVLD